MASELQVCNDALARCGCESIAALSGDGSTEAQTCARVWPGIRRSMLGLSNWHFATFTRDLSQRIKNPAPPWTRLWQLPAESMLRIVRVTDASGRDVPFDRVSDGVVTGNVEDPWIHWIGDTPIELWPAPLVEAVTLKLAAILALALREDPTASTGFMEMVNREVQAAMLADSQGRTTVDLGDLRGFRRARMIG